MPSAKSEERIKAEQIYHDSKGSIKLVEIAKQLGVSPSKVRKWKSLDGWDEKPSATPDTKKKQVERSTTRKGSVPLDSVPKTPKKRGPPKGNKNAVGNSGGAPLRNKNSKKHGIYAGVFWDFLDEKEAQLVNNLPTDEEQHLLDEIALLTVRERRLMNKIAQLHQQETNSRGLMLDEVLRTESKREFDSDDDKRLYDERQRAKVENNEILPGRSYQVSTRTKDNSDLLLRAHAELTRVQSQKTRCVEALNKIRQSREEAKGNSLADDWIKTLTGGEAQDE